MQATLEQRALKLSILVTLGVSSLGVTFGLLAGSQSILFDGVFSTIDAAMSGLALLVARLAVREASERFQHGYWHLEPLVAALDDGLAALSAPESGADDAAAALASEFPTESAAWSGGPRRSIARFDPATDEADVIAAIREASK